MRFTILLTLLAAAVAYAAPIEVELVRRIPDETDNSGPSPHRDEKRRCVMPSESVTANLLMSRSLIVLGIAAVLLLQTKPWSRPTQRTPSAQLEESHPPEMLPRPTPELPTEIWMLIFDFADTRTLAAVSVTCRFFHAISMDALVSHLVWQSPERARRHLSTFWVRFQNKGRSVSSLTIKFTPFLRSETVAFDVYADIFQAMSVFRYGLRRLVICGTALPDNFFEFLDGLPSLQDLNLRQCIVPPSPQHLRTPPHLQTLSLVDLSPRCVGVYSAYFVHLFPSVTNVSIDHGPHAHHCSKLSVPTIECAPKRITLGPAVDDVSCLHYMDTLSLFRLHELETLVVIVTELHYPPFICFDRFPMKDNPHLTQLRRLQTLVAPPHVVELLARATSGLRRVAIQAMRFTILLALLVVAVVYAAPVEVQLVHRISEEARDQGPHRDEVSLLGHLKSPGNVTHIIGEPFAG
ncbi:F-box domain-containing protein [Mycena chlorophos]|uniref:F-box domain-containing protein n=1 Tax=Mycena chlorophos TaxID=658473 RepID=A0A8H6WS18_MYCCL|nr:F-box domain-containing protein [Mycena chlorophos]